MKFVCLQYVARKDTTLSLDIMLIVTVTSMLSNFKIATMLEVHEFISTDTAHTATLALRSAKSSCILSFMAAIKASRNLNHFKPAHLTKNSVD